MMVRHIALEGFRSHQDARFELGPGVNMICGPNGRGKTNLLEGIFLLSGVRSWRTGLRRELIGWGSPLARITATVAGDGRDYEVVLVLPRQGPMTATINGGKVSRLNPLSDIFRGVLFSPEDLMLVKGPPALRRDFMDSALSQLRPRYAALLARLGRVLQSKGRLLRSARGEEGDPAWGSLAPLPEYNAQLAQLGAALIRYRADFCAQLEAEAAAVQHDISGGREALSIEYKTVSGVADTGADTGQLERWLLEHLDSHREAEVATGTCLSGVHRDDLALAIGGRPARAFASQGQARSVALALRFAQREIFERDLGAPPVLLLDDVLSELDAARREYVCRGMGQGQVILTCCQAEGGFEGARVIQL